MPNIERSRIDEIVSLYRVLEISLKKSLESALRIGELLTEQKKSMKHGEFAPWLKKNLSFISDRTARRWMTLHRNRDRLKTDRVSDLTAAYKLLEEPKEASTSNPNDERTIVDMNDIEKNPFFDLSKIPPESIQHWFNVLEHQICQPLPYWILPVRRHPKNKSKYQLICDHDRWAAMRLAGRQKAPVAIVENMTNEKMESTINMFDNNWYRQYMEYLKLVI